ncbi:MAG: hypothetical protein IPK46_02745 [Saprospiraceae bacterium]|nr:hypothetical protein [Saprospiraceae bacterium]
MVIILLFHLPLFQVPFILPTRCTTVGTEQFCDSATLYLFVFPSFTLKLRAYLEGALINSTAVSAQGLPLMRDELRFNPLTQLSYMPKKDPYRYPVIAANGLVYDLSIGTAALRFAEKGAGLIFGFDSITSPSVLLTTGDNAIVDWVFVEMRDKDDAKKVISTRSALLQRDGDIVDLDGVSALAFPNTPYDAYYVAVKHRNHLGVMTASAISFQNLSAVIDFTLPGTPTFDFGNPSNYNYTGLAQNKFIVPDYTCLYAGDFDANGVIKFSNPGDDANILTTDVLTYPTNTLFVSNYNAAFGYLAGDYNMDGKAKLDNPNDDQSSLLSQIFLIPSMWALCMRGRGVGWAKICNTRPFLFLWGPAGGGGWHPAPPFFCPFPRGGGGGAGGVGGGGGGPACASGARGY